MAYEQATSAQPLPHYLTPLTIAHRSVLGTLLEAHRHEMAQLESFERLLDEKEAQIAAIAETLPEQLEAEAENEKLQPRRPKGYEESIRRRWENNWLGDSRWLDILINGDTESTRDRFLEMPFEQALEKQQYFKDAMASNLSAIGLRGLDNQVAEQRRRVEEIRKLREQTLDVGGRSASYPSKATATPMKPTNVKPIKIEFTRHQDLHLKKMTAPLSQSRDRRSECAISFPKILFLVWFFFLQNIIY